MKNRQVMQQRLSLLLDMTTATGVALFFRHNPEWFNPWNFSLTEWILGALLLRGAIAFYDFLVVFLIECCHYELLPTRTNERQVRYVPLDSKSMVFLTINAVHEWIFVQRLLHYIWLSSDVQKSPSSITFWNTAAALYLMFIVLDAVYAPCHHILHQPWCYPLIHKHHHRQHFPTRGYLDAGNEHPIEHVVGVFAVWCAVLAATFTIGAHFVTIFLFFNVHAALAMLNHSPYDVSFKIVGIAYSVGYHEMHHRKFTVNYAQYCMWYDHVMETFCYYRGPKASEESIKVEEEKKSD